MDGKKGELESIKQKLAGSEIVGEPEKGSLPGSKLPSESKPVDPKKARLAEQAAAMERASKGETAANTTPKPVEDWTPQLEARQQAMPKASDAVKLVKVTPDYSKEVANGGMSGNLLRDISVGSTIVLDTGRTSRVRSLDFRDGHWFVGTENSTYRLDTSGTASSKKEEPKIEEVRPVTREDGLGDVDLPAKEVKNTAGEIDEDIVSEAEKTIKEGHAEDSEVELNKPVEKVKEEDVSYWNPGTPGHGQVLYGAAREAMLKKQQRDFEEIKNGQKTEEKKEDKEPDTPDPEKNKQESEEFLKAKTEWKEARDRSDSLQTELYGENGSGGKYAEFLTQESKGWRRFVNLPRRFLGLQPKLSPELKDMEDALREARKEYFEKAEALKDLKKSPNDSLYVKNQKVIERYQRLLAHKLIVGVNDKKLGIQERQALENEKNSRLKPALELMRKYRYLRWGATAVGYAALAGATGGVAAAAIAGGAYAARLGGAMALGSVAGGSIRAIGANSERMSLKEIDDTNKKIKTDLFERGFSDSEAEINKMFEDLDTTRAVSRGSAAAVAVTAGFAGGSLAGSFTDGFDTMPPGKLNPEPPVNGGMIPPSGEGGTPPAEGGVNPPADGGSEAEPAQPESKVETEPEGETEEEPGYGQEIPVIKHTVVRGDNAWNIMEGKGPDAHPVGGESQVLKDMNLPLQERQYWLDQLFDYCDKHPEFAEKVGAVKSGGNIHLIHPGETINVSMLDEKLLELMQDAKHPGETLAEADTPSNYESQVVNKILASENPVSVNDLTIEEFEMLANNAVIQRDPAAISYFLNQGYDGRTLRELVESLKAREGVVNQHMTVQEYLNNTEKSESGIPVGGTQDSHKMVDNDPFVQEANASVQATEAQSSAEVGGITVKSVLGEDVTIHPVKDVNDMNLLEAGHLYNALRSPDLNPDVTKFLESLGMSRESFIEQYDSLGVRGQYDSDMTVGEWKETLDSGETVPPVTPFDGRVPEPGDVPVREASFDNAGQSLQNYISRIESPGIFDRLFGNDISGTFNKIADLNFGQIKEMASGDMQSVANQLGVSTDGYERWMRELQTEATKVPPLGDDETVRQYLTRINSPQAVA